MFSNTLTHTQNKVNCLGFCNLLPSQQQQKNIKSTIELSCGFNLIQNITNAWGIKRSIYMRILSPHVHGFWILCADPSTYTLYTSHHPLGIFSISNFTLSLHTAFMWLGLSNNAINHLLKYLCIVWCSSIKRKPPNDRH